ncbi:TRAM domain-containing protein [Natranaeroarchaeum sulfidigenes]|uniref:Putative RNA-binding protein, contains TRAM domain n=1 Tax=Natranaeroarchaeum sulfidigenes TaxID=2784880 RepID=A0A897MV80_9EURY|nr:TRAM domain-containing protein [Natranaeroarchaeum sulfidigenes]QSG02849.1 putative RNA-binding protein, contains TRAM domain [Natranaeroarchaeum sulfidigenes]
MEISEQLHCLFTSTVEDDGESYTVEIPTQEVQLGYLQENETYRVALLPTSSSETSNESDAQSADESEPPAPPVKEGEQRTVEIESLGDQGDGLTRVERGFVVIVPDTERGERVTVEITEVKETVAFAEVLKRVSYYE